MAFHIITVGEPKRGVALALGLVNLSSAGQLIAAQAIPCGLLRPLTSTAFQIRTTLDEH